MFNDSIDLYTLLRPIDLLYHIIRLQIQDFELSGFNHRHGTVETCAMLLQIITSGGDRYEISKVTDMIYKETIQQPNHNGSIIIQDMASGEMDKLVASDDEKRMAIDLLYDLGNATEIVD